MKRRDFLTFAGRAGAALSLPLSLTAPAPAEARGWSEMVCLDHLPEPAVTPEVHQSHSLAMLRAFERGGFREIRGFRYKPPRWNAKFDAWEIVSRAQMR